MKVRIKILPIVMVLTAFMCMFDAYAKQCPAGFFCTANGSYSPNGSDIQPYQKGPADLFTVQSGDWSEEGLCASHKNNSCTFYTEDYDEMWVSTWFGFYFVKNGEVSYHSSANSPAVGAFPCPSKYPSSDAGSISVFDCYKGIGDGKKEYYKTPTSTYVANSSSMNVDLTNIKTLVNNLQDALNVVNKAAQDLQNALNNQNSKNDLIKTPKAEYGNIQKSGIIPKQNKSRSTTNTNKIKK